MYQARHSAISTPCVSFLKQRVSVFNYISPRVLIYSFVKKIAQRNNSSYHDYHGVCGGGGGGEL